MKKTYISDGYNPISRMEKKYLDIIDESAPEPNEDLNLHVPGLWKRDGMINNEAELGEVTEFQKVERKESHMYHQKSKSTSKKKNLAGPRLCHQKTTQQQSLERRKVRAENSRVKWLSKRSGILKQEKTRELCPALLLGEKYFYFSSCHEMSGGEAVAEDSGEHKSTFKYRIKMN